MKKLLSLMLAFIFLLTTVNMNLFSVYGATSTLSQAYGWYEAIHIEWTNDNITNTDVSYKLSSENQYTSIDKELIRANGTGGVADIVGIETGIYDIKVTTTTGTTLTKNNINVAQHDRSGYGNYNLTGGLGGYTDKGTPKSDAKIVYVTNETKNTVTLGSYTGIGNILSNANTYSYPIIVRIIGKVDTQTRDADGTKTTDINNGVVAINGITDKTMSADSYFNMMDVSEAKNITIEGIGSNAIIEKWGFTFSKCNSIEIRNLTFTKYPEDACSFEGSSSKNSSYKNYWVHNNYFKKGENKYDLTDEQDKGDGDGSSDFKGCRNITYSYNVFEECHKTSLHGGSDSSLQYNSTWHHNYFINCGARLPLTRQVNLHTYNNYYYKSTTCTDARASAWVFAESNYFENCSNAFKTTKSSSYGDPIVKSYNNIFSNSGKTDSASTINTTTDRTLTISATSGTNANKNPYPNFDTNSSVFYYDSTNKRSDVTYLTNAETAKTDSVLSAGLLKENAVLDVYLAESSGETTETTTAEVISNDSERYNKVELLISQMREETDPTNGSIWNKENTTAFKWSYINGCMASAMMMLGNAKNDSSYTTFADTYMSPFIGTTKSSTKGYIADNNFKISNYTLDDINSGKALIKLISEGSANSSKYNLAVSDTLYNELLQYELTNQTTAEGSLWHKKSYPYQVWLDGIYMETPFWLEYELEIGNSAENFTTASNNVTKQIENVYNKLRDSSTGLYYHGYDAQADSTSGSYNSSNAVSWAEKGTGKSSSYWLRSIGWYAMALVDNIELIEKAETKYNIDLSTQKSTLVNIYTDLMDSMLKYQDSDTKLWYQVVDKPYNDSYNYLETSGSAAISYALMKGYNLGIANIDYYNSGLEVFRSLCDNKLEYTNSNKNTVTLKDICMTAGLAGPSSGTTSSSATIGPKYTSRDGSYNYYVSEKTVENDAKGVAPLLFAYCQILDYNNGSEPTTETTTALTTETTTETTTYISSVGETTVIGGNNESVKMLPSDFSTGTPTSTLTSGNGVFTLHPGKLSVSSNYINLGGGGSFTQNSIAIKADKNATLTIKYFNSTERTLEIKNTDGSFLKQTLTTSGSSESKPDTVTYSLPTTDTYYIYSTSGGIRITEVTLSYSNGTSILIGDVNLDGKIDKQDTALLLKHISGITEITDENQLIACDCNKDNKYTILDVIAILNFIQ